MLREIDAARAAGREVWLASGADPRAVEPLAETVGATGCITSDDGANLTGEARAAALVARFGESGFDYLGHARRDLPAWRSARRAIGAGLSAGLARTLRGLDGDARLLPGCGRHAVRLPAALRPHQWIKNTMVFVPLLAAHGTDAGLYLRLLGVFAALSACASAPIC